MAARRLQRQREDALAALTDAEAIELAQRLVPTFKQTVVHSLLVCSRLDVRSLLAATGDQRAALAVALGQEPTTARVAISLRWREADVEAALGITRTAAQQRS